MHDVLSCHNISAAPSLSRPSPPRAEYSVLRALTRARTRGSKFSVCEMSLAKALRRGAFQLGVNTQSCSHRGGGGGRGSKQFRRDATTRMTRPRSCARGTTRAGIDAAWVVAYDDATQQRNGRQIKSNFHIQRRIAAGFGCCKTNREVCCGKCVFGYHDGLTPQPQSARCAPGATPPTPRPSLTYRSVFIVAASAYAGAT